MFRSAVSGSLNQFFLPPCQSQGKKKVVIIHSSVPKKKLQLRTNLYNRLFHDIHVLPRRLTGLVKR